MSDATKVAQCKECGKPTPRFGLKVCSRVCRRTRKARATDARWARGHRAPSQINRTPIPWSVRKRGATPRTHACVGCGLNFDTVQTRHESRTYCSLGCNNETKLRVQRERTYLRGLAEAVARERDNAAWSPTAHCTLCHDPLKRGRLRCDNRVCVLEHGKRRYHATWQPVPEQDYHCEDCGRPGVGNGAKRLCRRCVSRRRGHWKTESRCRKYGVPFDSSVTRPALLDRDTWLCQSCGIGVVEGGDTNVPNYAHVDHVVPLSAGIFGHTWDNTQILCNQCNIDKAATVPDEFTEQHPLWVASEAMA